MYKVTLSTAFSLLVTTTLLYAAPDNTQLAVWANEAIVATYSFNYKNFLERQKEIAKYFTAEGWTNYTTALLASKLPEAVQSNSYFVSSVAQKPPVITPIAANQWQAVMPLLVLYKNPQYQQQQTLMVTIEFKQAIKGQGVRGLAVNRLKSQVVKPSCKCDVENDTPPSATSDAPSPQDEKQLKPPTTK
ncbi:MAG: DotI/IcmL family type IV secretion protein [Tatlockia sp.]|jgi:hypothetical protein